MFVSSRVSSRFSSRTKSALSRSSFTRDVADSLSTAYMNRIVEEETIENDDRNVGGEAAGDES